MEGRNQIGVGHILILCVVMIFGFIGCASDRSLRPFGITGPSTPAAIEMFSSLRHTNGSLMAFKGLGNVILTENGKLQRFRAAWAAADPDKLRLQLFGPTGQPVFSIASDGGYYYIYSNEEEGVTKQRVADTGLKRYIEIPIGVPDLLSLFTGRVPAEGTDLPIAHLKNDPLHETTLVLINSTGEWMDTVYLDEAVGGFRKIERRDRKGRLVWRAQIEDGRMIDKYRIPNRIILSGEGDITVRIEVERFWANPSVPNDLFVIESP